MLRTIAFSALALKALALPQAGYIIGSPIMETTSTSMTMTTSTSTSTGVSMSTGTGLPGSPSTGTAEGSYKCYRGTDFPAQSEWLSFNDLLAVNQPTLQNGNTPEIYNAIVADIQSVASAAQIPPQIVLAQIMQESGGALDRISDKGKSIGLMQVQTTAEAPVRCSPDNCGPDVVLGMIQQGVNGHTGSGDPVSPGIAFYLRQYPPGASLRWYNTGSLPDPKDYSVVVGVSTQSYVSDIANRLKGLSPQNMLDPQQLLSQCGFVPGDSS